MNTPSDATELHRAREAALGNPPRGFYRHGARLRVNTIAFLPEDAQFLAEEAARRDCAPADVVRDLVRSARLRGGK